ncbi:Calponin homology domain-containing protein [Artemisia annua]|uniref:Calponin homology domain-containing protein n=1 Tax=Artemisia annua TaxID=35608 RepID=A0A2U1N8A4_ARTAN|nr:Calponin homology domain-containing protein [Artemisia annua]
MHPAHLVNKSRNGLSTLEKPVSFLEISPDEAQITREESAFCFWINSLGVATYINNVFEDVRNGSMMRLNLLSDPLLYVTQCTSIVQC